MGNEKKHILVISQYFYPEQFRINDMCKEWVSRGYKVTVVTGIPNYPVGKYFDGYGLTKRRTENYEGAEVIRIPLIPRGNNAIMLALNYCSFVVSGFFWKIFSKVKADCVFIFEVSPMTQALPGVWYAKKHKIPCYLYVQDLWPENVEIITGITNPKIIGSIGKMVDYIYRNCTKIFTTSNSFVEAIKKRSVLPEKIEYWPQYAEDFYQPMEKTKDTTNESPLQVVFAGNIGDAQGLDVLPRVAIIIKKKSLKRKIIFNIIGDGRYKETLVNLIKENQVENMFRFTPKQSATEIPKYMTENDVAFLCLTSNPLFEMTIPAKLQSYMACGMPILASVNGEAAKIIKDAKAGFVGSAGDENELANNLAQMAELSQEGLVEMGKNAKRYYDTHFNKEELLNTMDKYLQA